MTPILKEMTPKSQADNSLYNNILVTLTFTFSNYFIRINCKKTTTFVCVCVREKIIGSLNLVQNITQYVPGKETVHSDLIDAWMSVGK